MTPVEIQAVLDDSAPVELTLTIKQIEVDTTQLEQWLYGHLEIDPRMPAAHFDDASAAVLTVPTVLFLTGAAQVALTLLNSAGIPVLKPATVALEKLADETVSLKILLPTLAQLPAQNFNFAFHEALRLCKHAQQLECHAAQRTALNQYLDRQVLPKLRLGVFSGGATVPVLLAAQRAEIPLLHLGGGIYSLGIGSARRLLFNSVSDQDSMIGAKLTSIKAVTTNLLKKTGLPTPNHVVAYDYRQALEAAEKIGWPVVVKPVDGERGEGVSMNIANSADLQPAVELALKYSKLKGVLVEQPVNGVCYRLFVANGALLYVVKRPAIDIIGNGEDTVATLAERAYQNELLRPSWQREKRPSLDDEAIAHLATLRLEPNYIPAAGESVPLRLIESTASGGGSIDVTAITHPDNVAIAIKAASAVGLDTVGVDIICEDISVPWHQGNAVINELNFQPRFGSGEVSRGRIPKFLNDYLLNVGMIPIETFAANEAEPAARQLTEWQASGLNAALLNSESGEISWGDNRAVAPSLLKGRQQLRALLLNRQLDALAIVGEL
ncbi:MAG: hypothetical protein ACN4EJ_07365 [Porticoccaceae bacterium]